jgi:hypothetical protein
MDMDMINRTPRTVIRMNTRMDPSMPPRTGRSMSGVDGADGAATTGMAADTEDTEDTAAMVGDTGAVAKTIRASAAYQQLCEGPEAAAKNGGSWGSGI